MKQKVETIAAGGGRGEGQQQMMAIISLPKKRKLMASNIPEEMLVEILSRLPVKYLLRFRCVSKGWRNLIDDPHFITQHFNHSPKNNPAIIFYNSTHRSLKVRYESSKEKGMYEFTPIRVKPKVSEITIVGCCNGLVCLNIFLGRCIDYLCIWNPATRQVKYMPEGNRAKRRDLGFGSGFGFDPIHNDYKVVHICQFYGKQKNSVLMYSLSTGEWRELGEVSFNVNNSKRPVFVNGAVHWMSDSKFIISFDIALEKFLELPEHDYGGKDELLYKSLGTIGGYLSVVYGYSEYLEIWAMKDYSVKQSWTKLITICNMQLVKWFAHGNLEVIEIQRDGKVMTVLEHMVMFSYDPKSGTIQHILCDGRNFWKDLDPYVESLVPILPGKEHKGNSKA